MDSGLVPSGVVANEPSTLILTYMDRVPFDPAFVTDWIRGGDSPPWCPSRCLCAHLWAGDPAGKISRQEPSA
jgi:hypothetical protein